MSAARTARTTTRSSRNSSGTNAAASSRGTDTSSELHPEATAVVRERIHDIRRLEEILPAVQAVAVRYEGVYLVGGAVRDVLAGEQSLDLDLMVEGDAIAFAAALARELGGHSHPHEQFHTAVVKAGDTIRVDVASARTETYDAPGALPRVERATLRHDLERRDFTINAMAASLRAADLGATYDFFGGYDDLRAKAVRVLHDRSFVEDPTRLLRALRYETRLGFRMEPHTESLARECVERRLLADLASTRVRDELLDLLIEERAIPALLRMAELGIDRTLHPQFDARAAAAHVEAADAALQGPLAQARVHLVRVACLCAGMEAEEVCEWLDRLKFTRRDADVVAAAVTLGPRVAELASGPEPPALSELNEVLAGQPLEALAMAIVLSDQPALVGERMRDYAERTRGVRLEITGDDLRREGIPESPQIGAALKQTLALKLDGRIGGREEELATALRIIGRDPGTQ